MPLELCHVRLSDGPAVAEIYGKCFAGTPLYTVLHPGMDEAALSNDFLTRWPGMFTNPKGFYIGVKETDTDTLVAFTRYMKVNIPLSETEQEALRTWKPPVKARKNWAFERFFQSELQSVIEEDGRLQEAGGRPQLWFVLVATLPEYRRRGAAGMMLRYGTEMADANGWCMYADSTATAVDMYPKHGFDGIGEITVDLGEWGGDRGRLHKTVAFIRATRGTEAAWMRG